MALETEGKSVRLSSSRAGVHFKKPESTKNLIAVDLNCVYVFATKFIIRAYSLDYKMLSNLDCAVDLEEQTFIS